MWSIARYILTTQRSSLPPLLFETLLFLKVNNRFWSQETVVEAIAMARSKGASDRLAKKLQEEEEEQAFDYNEIPSDDDDDILPYNDDDEDED